MTELPVGTILKNENYEERWGESAFYKILEKYRPENKISHKEAVFLCANEDDIDCAGGGTEFLFEVLPLDLNKIERHDVNWSSQIECLLDEGKDENSPEIIKAAENYWNSVPYEMENVWEYLTPSGNAKIQKVEVY